MPATTITKGLENRSESTTAMVGGINDEIQLEVVERHEIADSVALFSLKSADGQPLPEWLPGAHIDLILTSGVVRQYSLCGDPRDRHAWKVAVKQRNGGKGGSLAVHRELSVGSSVRAGKPRNNFRLEPASRYLFIAGGIGITPLVPMIAAAHEAGVEWQLKYFGSSRHGMPFADELSQEYGGRVSLLAKEAGERTDITEMLTEPLDQTLVYCCGPESLLQDVESACETWPVSAIRTERFTPRTVEPGTVDESFEVEFSASGVTVSVPPDKSILQCATEAGLYAPSSCGEGTCGTCETAIILGHADHRDSLLSQTERNADEVMMICVSRAKTPRLVLDL
ncbi:PDR/VanB family oxidoreductase [Pseudarthrobacter sulfonivorans]|uniref:PDR/VanB family oxidoreductase n=1 Tax=Pseudarthrobacter sulfonivorans TaxID=121292 RepID=UPI002784171F|nr:PDR/VanB family oxidoreductase [Pseudarthrobacter sulfonivorans]MDQ0000742.1 ferredoxin-NADP reductase [Pseudarthrobacter sulfonivorans]